MEFSQLIKERHSVRYFSANPVSQDDLLQIVEEASQTASWVNSQPWKVYVAKGELLEAIKKEHIDSIKAGQSSRPIFPVLSRTGFQEDQQVNMADWSKDLDAYDQVENEVFWQLNRELFRAPAIMYFALPKDSPEWSILDLGAFVQTASLSANNLGLGTMVAYELIKFPDLLAEKLAVDAHYDIVIGMAIGYEASHPVNAFRSNRRSLDDLLQIVEK